jgi:hypothetical protein
MAKKQLEVPGTERETIPEVEKVASKYVSTLYERMRLQIDEKVLRQQVLDAMKAHKVKLYIVTVETDDEDVDYEIRLKPTGHKLQTKKVKPKVDDDGGDEE